MIILTAEQAAAVRGATSSITALDPIALADGATFVLSERVLDDPRHACRYDSLASLPQREVLPQEFPPPPAVSGEVDAP